MSFLNGKKFKISLRIVVSLAIAFLICNFSMDYFESFTYDARFRLKPTHSMSGNIEIIAVDRKTTENLKVDPNLKDHNLVLKNILNENPHTVIYFTDPSKLKATHNDKLRFADIASSFQNFIINYDGIPVKGEEDKLLLPEPLNNIKRVPGVISTDAKNFAADNVSRRGVLSYEGFTYIQPYVASFFNGITDVANYQGVFEFRNSKQIHINFNPSNSYKTSSFYDILEDRFPKGKYSGKIVLIGTDDLLTTENYIKTPFSRDVIAMNKLEAHANIIDTLILNKGIIKTPKAFDYAFTSLICLVALFIVMTMSPTKGFVAIIGTLLSFVSVSWVAFVGFNVAIDMAHPLLAIFICYYIFIPYRLIKESRMSWEYKQKNKLLTQVEELKTNFLGMMSHDLKTPLARIQGMAELALQDESRLSGEQKKALGTISQSSEELTEFISSILDLSRVESQKVKLNLEPRDVNEIMEDVIKKFDYLAKAKNIEIVKELEPLFSVKLDVGLMKQVFCNLLENAIKYSPSGSKILISTEEIGDRIIVQVADQGIGIPLADIENIFSKFYRSNSVKNTKLKGSGLGLYLAKYFIDLHKGDISVESQANQGSTFTVNIPMNQ